MFRRLGDRLTDAAGSTWALLAAAALVLLWAVAGPFLAFSDTWLLLINTVTTIVTFLMVFVIQAGQNRTTRAIQVKLDELIRAGGARNQVIGIELDADERIAATEAEILEEKR